MSVHLGLELDDAALERLADALVPLVLERVAAALPARTAQEWFTSQGAADYLGLTRRRIHDLKSARRLVADGYDGTTPLFRREVLDAYALSWRGA